MWLGVCGLTLLLSSALSHEELHMFRMFNNAQDVQCGNNMLSIPASLTDLVMCSDAPTECAKFRIAYNGSRTNASMDEQTFTALGIYHYIGLSNPDRNGF